MIKKIAALLTAGIFFLTAPNFAQAEQSHETNSVDKPFETSEEEITHPPLDPAYRDPPTVEEVEGLEFLVYHKNGVMAFAVIADHEKYFVRPVLAKNQIPGRATVSQMNSPEAIATINASYFGVKGTIYGNTKIDGLTAGTTYFIRSAVGIRADGTTIFARQVYRGVLQFNGEEVVIDGVDCERNSDGVVVYNGWQGATTGTNNFGVELVVQDGVVTNIFRDKGNNYIPPNGFVVSAHGTAAEKTSNTATTSTRRFTLSARVPLWLRKEKFT